MLSSVALSALLLQLASFGLGDPMVADFHGPFTTHFQQWLANKDNYYNYPLAAVTKYGQSGSFGGKISDDQEVTQTPIIFIHGNSDSALAVGGSPFSSGWNAQINYFATHGGYTAAEMYGLTYGDRNISNSHTRHVSCADLIGHRRFLEAVLEYTGSKKVSIIAHSMGVTIARKILQGGLTSSLDETCDLGLPLREKVDTLIALAGANYGMCSCRSYESLNACNRESGFYPGDCMDDAIPSAEDACGNEAVAPCGQFFTSYGRILSDINDKPKDADFVVSCWSDSDDIIGIGNWVWGRRTSLVPHSDTFRVVKGLNHMEVKTDTVSWQFKTLERRKKH